MNIKEIIELKSLNEELTAEQIKFAVDGYCDGSVTDYQMSALLMAIKINGMTDAETFALTDAMLKSGEILDLSELGTTVDKHSTGGVSDSTTMVLAPICAVCGINMLKLSGRGLGFTGGTIDKLEVFEGFDVSISIEKAKELVKENGSCVVAATLNLAPADKKIYALRDTTSTVASIPLIASSIMSKKLASGADVIVLDVKYGDGAFMSTYEDAKLLGETMKRIGEAAGKKVELELDDMNEPLGYNVGNKLETYEAIEVLKGKKGKLTDVSFRLASKCISLGNNISIEEAEKQVADAVESGKALDKFKQMVIAQGGDATLFDGIDIEPKLVVKSDKAGKVVAFKTRRIGELVGLMGATRQKITDVVDNNVGIKTFHKLNESVNVGDVILEIYAKDDKQAEEFAGLLKDCIVIE